MSLARKTAVEFNLRELRKHSKGLYLWTFTFPRFARPDNARGSVNKLIRWLGKQMKASGVRTYENHKRGGLHVHAVVNKHMDVRRVRERWRGYGGGRVHVLKLDREKDGSYIAKECTKNRQQYGMERGVRVYATFGPFWKRVDKSRVNDIEFRSNDFWSHAVERGARWSDTVLFNYHMERQGVGYATTSEVPQPDYRIGGAE